jgi:type IV pilus assembly protein PilP
MHFNNYIFLFIVVLVAGCDSYTSNHDDLAQFLKKVDSLPTEDIIDVAELPAMQKKQYQSIKKRSPFTDPLNYTILNNAQVKVAPDVNRKKSMLEAFDLGSFVMLGHLSDNNENWALVKLNSSNQIYSVKVGSYLGKNHGRITKIDDYNIYLVEIAPLGKSWVERDSVINLKK